MLRLSVIVWAILSICGCFLRSVILEMSANCSCLGDESQVDLRLTPENRRKFLKVVPNNSFFIYILAFQIG